MGGLPSDKITEQLVVISATPDRPTGLGVFQHENHTCDLTLYGVAGHQPPAELAEMLSCMADFAPPHVVAALRDAECLTDAARHRFPVSRWQRYDRLPGIPDGLIAFGDAIASFNPTYGGGRSRPGQRIVVAGARQYLRAAERDAELSARFLSVFNELVAAIGVDRSPPSQAVG